MSDDTVQRGRVPRPVRALQVEVLEGRDRGLSHVAAGDAVGVGTARSNDLALTDPTVSRFHLEVARRGGALELRDPGSTNGTVIGPVTVRGATVLVEPGTVVRLGDTALRVGDAEKFVMPGAGPERFGGVSGASAAIRGVTATLAKLAGSDVSVLLAGESGTGKEVAARAVHAASRRAAGPFVTVDCGVLSPTLFASELFGHERGAFTGADRKRQGAFERAHGGTLFLDEVAELSAELQAALLGVLERRRVVPLGGAREIPVDVRVIAATHRDLRAGVNAGTFRLDLYYRLAQVRVAMPALRERTEDIVPLARGFLAEAGTNATLEQLFPPEVLEAMVRHDWPGNVRELRNFVLGAVALGAPPPLEGAGASAGPGASAGSDADVIEALLETDYRTAKQQLLDLFERRWLARLLSRTQGNVRAASREGRIERNHLTELLRKHGLK